MDSTIKLGQFILFKSGSNASNPSSPTFREKRSQKKHLESNTRIISVEFRKKPYANLFFIGIKMKNTFSSL
jgi:hypothetical protein